MTLLSGFPFVAGLSEVQAIDPNTGLNVTLITGLSSAIDIIPLVHEGATVGYLTLEYSLAHLAGGPGRLQVFNAAGASIAVLANNLITPSSMAVDWRSGTVIVAEISLGGLELIRLPE